VQGAQAGMKPVSYRLASLPASAAPEQKLVLCAANVGTGAVDVTLEFVDVKTSRVVAEKTVTLAPLGSAATGASAQPCVTVTASDAGASREAGSAMAASFAPSQEPAAADGEALMIGVALVRKPLLSFREAQVTASIQVMRPDGNGAMRTVETVPLNRATRSSDGAPISAPAESGSRGHHK